MNRKYSLGFFLSLVIAGVVALVPARINASHVLLSDDFSGDSSNWTEFSPWGSWQINELDNYIGDVVLEGYPEHQTYAVAGDVDWSNYRFSYSIKGTKGTGKVVLFMINELGNAYLLNLRTSYVINGNVTPSAVILGRRTPVGSPNAQVLKVETYPIQNDVWYDVEVTTELLGASNWITVEVDGAVVLEFLDNSPYLNGRVGLEVWPGGYQLPTIGLETETYYDNVLVESLSEPHNTGLFDLPFYYDGRGGGMEENFVNSFNSRYTSLFDHDKAPGNFVNFMGNSYVPEECDVTKEACYDSHTGVDFDDVPGDNVALSVANGTVVYRSEDVPGKGNENCKPHGGFGCAVIVDYSTDEHPDLYGLFAHLKEITATKSAVLTPESEIGVMGRTGRADGTHLHFSSMIKLPAFGLDSFRVMSRGDWEILVTQIASKRSFSVTKPARSFCNYTAPNGDRFVMVDPNGWSGEGDDPWAGSMDNGGCGFESPYLWMFQI